MLRVRRTRVISVVKSIGPPEVGVYQLRLVLRGIRALICRRMLVAATVLPPR
jgi:hypothetical protein